MRNIIKTKIFILMMVAIVSLVSGCGSSEISIDSVSGFVHKTSVRIPFDPQKDLSARLKIDNDGNALFFKQNEGIQGSLNPVSKFQPELYGTNEEGTSFSNKYGPFLALEFENDGSYFLAADDTNHVTRVNPGSGLSTATENKKLAMLLKADLTEYLKNNIITYDVTVSSTWNVKRQLAIYNTKTEKEVTVDLKENYQAIDTLDIDGENVLVKAVKKDSENPDFYILSTDGEIITTFSPENCADSGRCYACFVEGGFIVYTPRQILSSALGKYNFFGCPVWAHVIPLMGNPEMKVVRGADGEIVTLTVTGDDDERYIEHFNSQDGFPLYSRSFHSDSFIKLTDVPGMYFLYPQWSLYPEMDTIHRRISLYNEETETGYIEIVDSIDYFEVSSDGRYFAIVTKNMLSIFAQEEGK